MKIYVATKFENQRRVRDVATQLEAAGHQVTYCWWDNEQVSQAQAMEDYFGVTKAEALVIIAEEEFAYAGTYVEFGIALHAGLDIYIMGDAMDRCIFTHMPRVFKGIEMLLPATTSTSA